MCDLETMRAAVNKKLVATACIILTLCIMTPIIYRKVLACEMFCARIDGPADTGEPICGSFSINTFANFSPDTSLQMHSEFVNAVLTAGAPALRNGSVALFTFWQPTGFLWSWYWHPSNLFINTMLSFRKYAPNIVPFVVCVTDHSCDVLHSLAKRTKVQMVIFRDVATFQCQSEHFLDRTAPLKWVYALAFLSAGYRVLGVDTDVALLRNPLQHLDNMTDLQALTDSQDSNGNYWSTDSITARRQGLQPIWHGRPSCPLQPQPSHEFNPEFCVSTGFFYMQPTAATLGFVNELVRRLAADQLLWEQSLFNQLVYPHMHSSGMTFEVLDAYRFNNVVGFDALATNSSNTRMVQREEVVVVHVGGMHGPNEKVAGMRRFGVWLVPFWYY
eukprot:TRINITY_DN7923_c0_g1_i2.p1 TRINITY_DN7923_c0_g1~~TRINITY_DN7923_c0_g1_i2.p1  ORF type:complete len:388 (-),score=55.84 TRINITY_DN7923_c0_g1_i2:419-1582(-)